MKKNIKNNNFKILSVGGSIIIPPTGFDVKFLKKFRALILSEVRKGQKFILVIGGGATARTYQAAGRALGLNDEDLDWLGIDATLINADFVRKLFGKYAHDQVVMNPTIKVKTNKSIIIASGWKPGCSTDKDAVLLAKTYGATEVINVSNIDYIYTGDPRKVKSAKKLPRLTWNELVKIVGVKWRPGANVPFDPSAVALAKNLKLVVKFVNGKNLVDLAKVLTNRPFSGSIIC